MWTRFHRLLQPEFMREGSAVADFLNPPYTDSGASDTNHLAPLRELYKDTPATFMRQRFRSRRW